MTIDDNNPLSDLQDDYFLAKEIDNIPGEWTYKIFTLRALQYLARIPMMYEPLGSYRQILRAVQYRLRRISNGETLDFAPDVSLSLAVFESIFDSTTGVIGRPRKGEKQVGVHSIRVVDSRVDGSLRFANTWGTDWGDQGFGVVSRSYVQHHLKDGWLRRANLGPNPIDIVALKQVRTPEEFARLSQPGQAWDRIDLPNNSEIVAFTSQVPAVLSDGS